MVSGVDAKHKEAPDNILNYKFTNLQRRQTLPICLRADLLQLEMETLTEIVYLGLFGLAIPGEDTMAAGLREVARGQEPSLELNFRDMKMEALESCMILPGATARLGMLYSADVYPFLHSFYGRTAAEAEQDVAFYKFSMAFPSVYLFCVAHLGQKFSA